MQTEPGAERPREGGRGGKDGAPSREAEGRKPREREHLCPPSSSFHLQ